jgi:hypothetical protein
MMVRDGEPSEEATDGKSSNEVVEDQLTTTDDRGGCLWVTQRPTTKCIGECQARSHSLVFVIRECNGDVRSRSTRQDKTVCASVSCFLLLSSLRYADGDSRHHSMPSVCEVRGIAIENDRSTLTDRSASTSNVYTYNMLVAATFSG